MDPGPPESPKGAAEDTSERFAFRRLLEEVIDEDGSVDESKLHELQDFAFVEVSDASEATRGLFAVGRELKESRRSFEMATVHRAAVELTVAVIRTHRDAGEPQVCLPLVDALLDELKKAPSAGAGLPSSPIARIRSNFPTRDGEIEAVAMIGFVLESRPQVPRSDPVAQRILKSLAAVEYADLVDAQSRYLDEQQ